MISLETSTMQLIGGDLDGIRICRVEGESLVTSVIPRDNLLEAKQLPDIPPRGICYLLDEDHGNLNRVYTGQTTQGVTRLDAHKARKSIWNRAIIFLDHEASIDRGVLDALEATSISSITSHGSYETDNANIPHSQIGPDKEESSTLEDNLEFNSPSATAVFTLGGRRNGWTEWINNNGDTLDALYRKGME